MVIKTKFDIGQKVWVVKENETNASVEIFSEEISSIHYNGETIYYTKATDEEYYDDDFVPFEDTDQLLEKIKELDAEIIKKLEEHQ